MTDMSFYLPSKIIFGVDSISRIGAITETFGRRALLLTEFVLHEGKYIERVAGILRKKNIDVIILDNMSPGSVFGSTHEIVALTRASRTQAVIGMGGMRVLSLARKVAHLAGSPDDGERMKPVSYIEVPTVPRDTFLFSENYLEFDFVNHVPRIERVPQGLVQYAVIDPGLTATLPPKTVGTLVMDIALSAVEGLLSTRANFISDALLTESLAVIADAVIDGVRDPSGAEYRNKACQAGLLSAMGYAISSSGAGTGLAYSTNVLFRAPKSFVSTVILPHLLDVYSLLRPEKLARISQALGEDIMSMPAAEAACMAAGVVRRMIGQLGLPARLRDLGLKLEDLVEAATAASTLETMAYLPVPMTSDGLYDLVKKAY